MRIEIGSLSHRNEEKQAERERLARDIASGRIDPEQARVALGFIKNAPEARIVQDWDGQCWYDNE